MPLLVERRDRVAVLVLDDPPRRNALSPELVSEIVDTVGELERDDTVGALVVTGEPPAFCSGADVGNLAALTDAGADAGSTDLRGIYEGFLRVERSTLPTVAAVNGPAVGAGLNLALACDLRLASPSARFDSRFLSIGIHPGGGHAWFLERTVGRQAAAAMVVFGEPVDADRALELGLVWEVVADDTLVDRAVELAGRAAELPRPVVERAEATLREVPWQPDLEAAVTTELTRQAWSFGQPYFAERTRKRS
ncbi:MAG: enoyl-CoA hydratase-related protein [Acidimicrobiia bacterium]